VFVSYAQNFEDVMLWRAFRDVEHGFYVDLGAQDPLVDSVSQAFHERGWRGVHVEPSSFYAEALRQQRPGDIVIQAAVGDGAPLVTFFEIPNSGISTVDPVIAEQHRQRGFVIREMQVPRISLAAVFDACPSDTIHWLKIDIEGSERSALASWGSGTRRPWVVVVESTLPLSQVEAKHDWEVLLLERNYKFVYFDGLNRFYIAREKSTLKRAFRSPPNVFDAFAVNGTASSWIHRRMEERYREQADESTAAYRRLEEELRSEVERQHELVASHAEQLRVADQRLMEESRMLNEHIRMLLADMQQRQAHALEERERLNEAHREVQSNLETALAKARALEKTTRDAWEAAETALHGAQVDLEVARTRHALELDLRGAERRSLEQRLSEVQAHSHWLQGELERERSQAAAVQGRIDELYHAESSRLRQALESQALDAYRIAEQLAATRRELKRLQARPLARLWRALSSSSSASEASPSHGPGPASPPKEIDAPALKQALVPPSTKSDPNMTDPLESVMLDQLLTLNDVDFVRAAYRALLKREADPTGERNYLELLRSGHDKVRLLGDMARSQEAQRTGTSIPGLKGALLLRKLGRLPIVGPLALKIGSLFRRTPYPDPTAAMQQQALGMQRSVLEIVVQLQATVQKMQHQQMSMEQTLRRLIDRDSEIGMGLSTSRSDADWSVSRAGFTDADELKLGLKRKAAAWKV
jgi:FkbM family methyltransferase